jgi:hypothetical protein
MMAGAKGEKFIKVRGAGSCTYVNSFLGLLSRSLSSKNPKGQQIRFSMEGGQHGRLLRR